MVKSIVIEMPGPPRLALVEAGRLMRFNVYTTYVLRSLVARKSYVGMTDDLVRRLVEHNSGRSFFTNRYKPWEVIYTEEFETQVEAHKRELYFKSASGRRFLRKNVFKEM